MAYMQQLQISYWKLPFDVFLNDASFDIYLLKVQNINTVTWQNVTKVNKKVSSVFIVTLKRVHTYWSSILNR